MGVENGKWQREQEAHESLLPELMVECQSAGFVFRIDVKRGTGKSVYSKNGNEVGTLMDIKAIRFKPTLNDPMQLIRHPDLISAIEGEEINRLVLWISDNPELHILNNGTYKGQMHYVTPDAEEDERMLALKNPLPQSTLVGNALTSIAVTGGPLSISLEGLPLVASQIDTNTPIGAALNLTIPYIVEGFTATHLDLLRSKRTSIPGVNNHLRPALNVAGKNLKNGRPK